MHRYGTFITLIITLSTFFIGASPFAIGASKDTLSFHSLRDNDNLGSGPDPDVVDAMPSPENRDDLDQNSHSTNNDDSYPEDGDDLEYEFDPNDPIASDVLSNDVSLSSGKKRVIHVKDISCSGLAAGRNITGAVDEFVD
ncbi:hypothetical protein GGR51DRAFT_554803 [Nemania sp. FL0031]|nr:hypothetical protein GGR51DRAFT_554803 [Nemania sp. FL0031]